MAAGTTSGAAFLVAVAWAHFSRVDFAYSMLSRLLYVITLQDLPKNQVLTLMHIIMWSATLVGMLPRVAYACGSLKPCDLPIYTHMQQSSPLKQGRLSGTVKLTSHAFLNP